MRYPLAVSLAVLALLYPVTANPQGRVSQPSGATPVGRWNTIDDSTGDARSVVFIWQERGVLFGRIEKVLDANPKGPEPRCVRCEGELKDRPLVGLRILWDLRQDGGQWSGGRILDPGSGKTYRCSAALEGGGTKLRVRGFLGVSLFGRTQYWLRSN